MDDSSDSGGNLFVRTSYKVLNKEKMIERYRSRRN